MDLFKTKGRAYTDADFEAALAALSLKGRSLLVYSRLISFGRFASVEAITRMVELLQNAVGPKGTLAFVSYTFSGYNDEVYDPTQTKCIVGTLGELTRTMPGFVRTVHPIYANTVWGENAAFLMGQKQETCFGEGSFFELLSQIPNAAVMLLGTNLSATTIYHHYDQRFNAPGRFIKTFPAKLRDNDNSAEREITFDAYVKDYDFYADRMNCLGRLDAVLTKYDLIQRQPFAASEITLIDEKTFRLAHRACLDADQTYFLCSTKEEWETYYLKNQTRLFHGQLDPEKSERFKSAYDALTAGEMA